MGISIDIKKIQDSIKAAFEELSTEGREVSQELLKTIFFKIIGNYGDQLPSKSLPVSWAKDPDVTALFGYGKDKPLNLNAIHESAWKS